MAKSGEEFGRCIDAIKRSRAKTVGLQYPEGLKPRALDLAIEIERNVDVQVILSASASFGACDVREMPVDLIVHLGHAPMPDLHYRNVFFYESPLPPPENLTFLEKALPLLKKRVGLLTTVQFRAWLPRVRSYLEDKGYEVHTGKARGRIAYEGQLLGCDYSAARSVEANVDCFLFIGSGNFHPLAVAMTFDKTVVVADFEKGEARTLDDERDRMMRKRHAAIVAAKDAEMFGIVVSTKPGQSRLELAKNLKKLVEKHGKEAHVFVLDAISQEALEGYKVDSWVNTACPRVAIEDSALFKKPMLTPQELEISLGEVDWKEYELDEIRV